MVAGDTVERRIIAEIPDVISSGDEIEMSPFPFSAEETLVPGNRAGRERKNAVVVISQEVVERSYAWLGFPGEEVIPPADKGELAKPFGQDLEDRGYVQALHVTFPGVAEGRINALHPATGVPDHSNIRDRINVRRAERGAGRIGLDRR